MNEEIEKAYRMAEEYDSEEFPLAYRNLLVEKLTTHESFIAECLQKIYHSGELSGTRLLDFGCGPSVHKIASASLQFNDITLADWSEANRKAIEKWLPKDSHAFDWRASFEQCARAEGYRDLDAGVTEIETRVRKAVKNVIPCDAISKDILPDGIGEFDAINSSRCLESCCSTVNMYKEALRKLTKYLKKGGAIVIVSILEAQTYYAHKTLSALCLTEDMIKEALAESRLELKEWFSWKNSSRCELMKNKGVAVHYSIKR